MATYEVKHEDGRVTKVNSDSPDPDRIRKQANHAETSRVVIATRRGQSPGPDPSMATSDIKKIKD